MTGAVLSILVVAGGALFVYLRIEKLGLLGVLPALMRTVALAGLVLLLFNPSSRRRIDGGPTTVLLDASLSMDAAGGRWAEALDSARSLASDGGSILRFGQGPELFDTLPPRAGSSRLKDALDAAVGGGVPVVIVTDGELEDIPTIPGSRLARAGVLVLARDTLPNAAIIELSLRSSIQDGDSLSLDLTIATWGSLPATRGRIDVRDGERVLLTQDIRLPPSPGVARRRVVLPPSSLHSGVNVLHVVLDVQGDAEERDDERVRLVSVVDQPAIVVLVNPADWEGRFLVSEIVEVSRTSVQGFARVGENRWIDMRSLVAVDAARVRAAARAARVLVVRGQEITGLPLKPIWRWPAGSDPRLEIFEGDWYIARADLASPFAGRLAGVEWDSLPPLTGIVPLVAGSDEWSALIARQGRRGAERPVLLGRDSAGTRQLTTAASGVWRWAFRGGASREAYRAVVAAGIDWLLGAGSLRRSELVASEVVQLGMPVVFETIPGTRDSAVVRVTGADTALTAVLRFSAEGKALLRVDPGVYTWTEMNRRDESGTFVVEPYSDEFHLRNAAIVATSGVAGNAMIESRMRQRWWVFVLIVLALAAEWTFRQRKGLP